jgi:hypothetical protein
MERETKQTIVLGYNGTGKSTLVSKIIEAYAKQPGRKALVITPDPVEWRDKAETILTKPSDFKFEGIRRYIWSTVDKTDEIAMQNIGKWYYDGMLIFDDCRSYIEAFTPPWLKYLYLRRRHKMIDLMLVAHGFTDVPPQAFTNCSDLFLFRTNDKMERRKRELNKYDELLAHQARINRKAETNKHYYERIIF